MKNYFKIATLAGLVLASMLVTTSCSIKKGAVKTFDKFVEHGPYDVAIVPGIPYDPDKVNVLFKARMLWAKSLYDRGIVRNIIFSGAAVHSPYTEAVAMKLIAEEMGIAPEHISSAISFMATASV